MLFDVEDAAREQLVLAILAALCLSLMRSFSREAVRRILTSMVSWFPVCGGVLQGLQQVVEDIMPEDLQPPRPFDLDLEPEPVDTPETPLMTATAGSPQSPSSRSYRKMRHATQSGKRFHCTGYPQSLQATVSLYLEESPELPETAPSQTAPTPTETPTAHEADTTVALSLGSELPQTTPRRRRWSQATSRRLEMHTQRKFNAQEAWEEKYLRTGCPYCGTDQLSRLGSSHLGRNLRCAQPGCGKHLVWVSFH